MFGLSRVLTQRTESPYRKQGGPLQKKHGEGDEGGGGRHLPGRMLIIYICDATSALEWRR